MRSVASSQLRTTGSRAARPVISKSLCTSGAASSGRSSSSRPLALLAVGESLEEDADDRRVDEGRLGQIDDERRLRAERGGEIRPDAGGGERIGLAAERDHAESVDGVHGFSIARSSDLKP